MCLIVPLKCRTGQRRVTGYTHSIGQVTIEIKSEAAAEFGAKETQSDDGNPGLETTN
jgi:hypothetical protein